jgi:hypothetical protein
MSDYVKSDEQMYLEDVVDVTQRILTAPLPMVGNRQRLLEERIKLVLAVTTGTVHPGDVQMAPLSSIDGQFTAALGR